MCAAVCICGAVNVRELFKRVVVYFGGLVYMCSSLFIFCVVVFCFCFVKLPLPECKLYKG